METNLCFIYTHKSSLPLSLSDDTNKSQKLKVYTHAPVDTYPSGWKGKKESHPKLHESFMGITV